ncbi:aminodeoxychorismate lyase [Sodalis-like symbiont of Bactericera trigonica]|nr:aminodeoxychorismate lyase [Sodalis-like symbiont of Bactericera trigonica]
MYWINGIPQAQLPLADRTIHLGDGFFTTARLLDGDIPLLAWHLERLSLAVQRLLFAPLDADALRREMLTVAGDGGDGVLKALISRGSGGQGYSFSGCGAPVPVLAGIKHNNRLEQVLISAHLERDAAHETLVLDTKGGECASTNLFWRRGYALAEVAVGPEALATADKVFITNALLPIVPVKAIDERHYADRTLYLQLYPLC